MNAPENDLVELSFDDLQGIDGYFSYFEYHRQFNGNFDAAGNPVLAWAPVKTLVPIALPAPGQVFHGTFVPHERLPFFCD